jgi:thymidylate synthase
VPRQIADWPAFYRDSLTVGNPASSVGICTLWTPRSHISAGLEDASYAVVGNLYSREGIGLLVRNVLASPTLRHLVVCGADLSGTGQALSLLIKEGARAHPGLVDPAIPAEAVDEFCHGVAVHDYRGERDPQRLRHIVEGLDRSAQIRRPRLFPRPEPRVETYPTEPDGLVVRADSVAETWLRALADLMRFGEVTPTEYGSRQREVLNLLMVVEREDPHEPELPFWLPVSRELIEQYARQVLEHTSDHGLSYTYGSRLRALRGTDQLDGMAAELQRCGHSRRAVAVLWDPEQDRLSSQPPCLISVQARLKDDTLHLMAYLRSSDVHRAWPLNAFALLRMQALLARRLGVPKLGPLATLAGSAHVYEESWPAVSTLIDQQARAERSPRLQRDPRGSFAIRVISSLIEVEHFGTDGRRIARYESDSVEDLQRRIAPFVSLPAHALYLGRELALAEQSLHTGWPYVQDAHETLTNLAAGRMGSFSDWCAALRGDHSPNLAKAGCAAASNKSTSNIRSISSPCICAGGAFRPSE